MCVLSGLIDGGPRTVCVLVAADTHNASPGAGCA